MKRKDDLLEYPTISELTADDKEQSRMGHVDVMDLLKRIEELEKENKRINVLEQQIEESKNIEKKDSEKQELEQTSDVAKIKNDIRMLYKIIVLTLVLTIGLGVWIVNPFKSDTSAASEIQEDNKINVSKGDIIEFGNYGGKAIEWQVLDVNEENNTALLISKYILFKEGYNNDEERACTWQTSTIRKYLIDIFYRDSFSGEEKKMIKEEVIKNSDNEGYEVEGGNDTRDKIFLLSIDEAKKYFKTDEDRKATLIGQESGSTYWLRSPGEDSYEAAYVNHEGYVSEYGDTVNYKSNGIRPAMWIDVSNLEFSNQE